MIAPEYLAKLRRRHRAELVLAMVQLEQVCPGWWLGLEPLADQLGTDRQTLNRSIRQLERLGLIRRCSISNTGGTWVWWVKRHESDVPSPGDEPAWVLRRLNNRKLDRIPISQRKEWAKSHGVPLPTLCSLLYGHQRTLHGRWELASTPMDSFHETDI